MVRLRNIPAPTPTARRFPFCVLHHSILLGEQLYSLEVTCIALGETFFTPQVV
jgi:hypothetical protein